MAAARLAADRDNTHEIPTDCAGNAGNGEYHRRDEREPPNPHARRRERERERSADADEPGGISWTDEASMRLRRSEGEGRDALGQQQDDEAEQRSRVVAAGHPTRRSSTLVGGYAPGRGSDPPKG